MKDEWNNYTAGDEDDWSHELDDNYISVSDVGHDIDLPDFSLRSNRDENKSSSRGRDRMRGNQSDKLGKRNYSAEKNSKKTSSFGAAHKRTADTMDVKQKVYSEKKSERTYHTDRVKSEKNISSHDVRERTKRTAGYGSSSDAGGLLSTIAEKEKTEKTIPESKKNSSHSRYNSSYSRENGLRSRENSSYSRKNSSYSRENGSRSRENSSYSGNKSSYRRKSRSYSTEKYNLPVSFDGSAVKNNDTAEYQKLQPGRETKSAKNTRYKKNSNEKAERKTRVTAVKNKNNVKSAVSKNDSRASTGLSRSESLETHQDDKHRATETVSGVRRQRISSKRSWIAAIAVVLAICVFVGVKTFSEYNSYLDLQAEKESLEAVYEEQLELSEELKEEEEYVQTDDYIEEMARKMGLLYPNEVIFKPEE